VITPLPAAYDRLFDRMLREVATAPTDPDVPLIPFWPIRGAAYDGRLMVIGRSVNGWVEDWTPRQLRDDDVRHAAVAWMRADAEPADGCRMGWVTDLWNAPSGYNTHRSALWRVLRRIILADPTGVDADHWSSLLAWTNLYKVSPGAGWNPGADLQRAQRQFAMELLALEIEAFAPQRILAMTGTWIAPFADGLRLRVEPRSGLVEGVGELLGRPCVVAKHPMAKPEDRFVASVLAAFAAIGAPIGGSPS
jgi:hypothetical protein